MTPPSPRNVERLTEAQVEEAGAVLARAFFDDPLWSWVEPDAARRAEMLPWFMGVFVRHSLVFGETYTTTDTAFGVACWVPPGASPSDPGPGVPLSGGIDAPHYVGDSALRRFQAMSDYQKSFRTRYMTTSFWYLAMLGVDPAAQRSGVASALIAPVLARADAAGQPSYLETEKEHNVGYYARHGFEVLTFGQNPLDGPPFWTMMRRPDSSRVAG
jgi:ribosomal protein S18 acetylase RimI-like enzyme